MNEFFLYGAIALFLFGSAWNAYSVRTDGIRLLTVGPAIAGWGLLCLTIASAWFTMGRPPFKTFFETFILLSWCLSVIALIAGFMFRKSYVFSMALVASAAVLIWALINPDLERALLPPALQSQWFVPHVTVYFFGYSMIILSGLTAFTSQISREKQESFYILADKLSLGAFLFLGAGLCLGAIWADDAWGTWWGWDPKESWALVTWLLVAGYRHLPMRTRLSRLGMMILVAGLGIMGFTYMGMHLLPTADFSVHVYSQS